ncbi:hypothetical protein Bca4012_028551 [Brassica carinata]
MEVTKVSITLFLVITLAISSNYNVLAESGVSKTTKYGECIYDDFCKVGKSETHECFVKCLKTGKHKKKKYIGGECVPKSPQYGYCCCIKR